MAIGLFTRPSSAATRAMLALPPANATPSAPANAAPSSTLELNFRCVDGSSHKHIASPTNTVAELKEAVQALTGIHKVSQRLVFAGSPLQDADVISSTSLVDGCSIFVLVNKSFPATLGPFQTATVGFRLADFQIPPVGAEFDDQGSMWLMEQRPLTRLGVRCAGVEFPLVGQFSPPHPVTLTDEEKCAIGIPSTAARFVWSYPVAGWTSVAGASEAPATEAARSFLSVGGFVYLDAANKAIHATTLVPSALEAGGLQFRRPAGWAGEWTAALMKQGRFQRITIKPLNDIGAYHFCWLRPGEVIKGADGRPCASQPDVPHGGFAYLFHEDVFSSAPEQVRWWRWCSGHRLVFVPCRLPPCRERTNASHGAHYALHG